MSDMALFNIMHKTIHNRKSETYVEYQINVAKVILQNVQLPDYKIRGKLRLNTSSTQYCTILGPFPKKISILEKQNPTRTTKFVINMKQNKSGNAQSVK